MSGYNFAYLDEQTKRMIRRAILKAVAIPGHQVPFGGREMPLPYGWGTGGIQVTAAILGAEDVLKVIDQGADDTTNAVSIRLASRPPPAPPRRPSSKRGTAFPRLRCGRTRSSSIRCRCRSPFPSWNQAEPKRARCMRSPNTA
jgi:hypothetical protein